MSANGKRVMKLVRAVVDLTAEDFSDLTPAEISFAMQHVAWTYHMIVHDMTKDTESGIHARNQ